MLPGEVRRYARRVRRECRRGPAGNTNLRELAGPPVSEHDLQLAQHHVPILAPGMPVLDDPPGCQVQHPPQGIVVGERRLVLCDLPELPGLSQILCKHRNAV